MSGQFRTLAMFFIGRSMELVPPNRKSDTSTLIPHPHINIQYTLLYRLFAKADMFQFRSAQSTGRLDNSAEKLNSFWGLISFNFVKGCNKMQRALCSTKDSPLEGMQEGVYLA